MTGLLWLLIPLLPLLHGGRLEAQPQTDHKTAIEIRELYPSEWGVPFPSGVSYGLKRDHLALVGKIHPGQSRTDGSVVAVITPYESGITTLWEGADGQVSAAFFKHFVVDIDFDEMVITLTPPESFRHEGGGRAVPLRPASFGSWTIPGEIVTVDGSTISTPRCMTRTFFVISVSFLT